MTDTLPFTELYNLGRLGQAGDEVAFAADDATRAAIARWADVAAVDKFAVTARLTKKGPTAYQVETALDADVVQECVVTLAPVPAHIDRRFVRELHFVGARRGEKPAEAPLLLDEGAEDPPEEIESLHYDLAAPALEEFALSLDPYPRAPGAEFDAPAPEKDPRESPFAVLNRLKNRT